jgi:hypothetical protein
MLSTMDFWYVKQTEGEMELQVATPALGVPHPTSGEC